MERLLAHPDTELHSNVMGQAREPIFLVLNRGKENYPLSGHVATFERRPEISKYSSYITDYIAKDKQIKDFDLSNSTSITYEDVFGSSHTNIGPVFGKPKEGSPTVRPLDNNKNIDSEL